MGLLFMVPFAIQKLDIDNIQASKLVAIMGVAELAGRLPWGFLGDMKGMNRHYLMSLMCVCIGLSFFAMVWVTSFSAVACVCAFSGIFQVAVFPCKSWRG